MCSSDKNGFHLCRTFLRKTLPSQCQGRCHNLCHTVNASVLRFKNLNLSSTNTHDLLDASFLSIMIKPVYEPRFVTMNNHTSSKSFILKLHVYKISMYKKQRDGFDIIYRTVIVLVNIYFLCIHCLNSRTLHKS